ncbi:polysulfide reductase [Prolixibacteraceae bacterium JC049]|nr:polysulfide reductase [Prolixibacteraceae bacterium JC049]
MKTDTTYKDLSPEKIENDLLQTVNWSRSHKLWMTALTIGLVVCLYFYYTQLRDGLGVTGMNDYVSWGIYISNFVFFVATSLIGMLISSVLGLLKVKWITPIARIAEMIAVAFAFVAGLVIIIDMGRPDRLHHVFVYGRIQSPILWDVVVVTTYVMLSLLLLYIPLIPDLAICAKKEGLLPKLQRRIYKALSLGWANTPAQFKIIKNGIRMLAVLIIPVALGIHTVTSWLFAMTLRSGWDSPIFGPYFVSGAFVTGCASVIILMYVFRKQYKLDHYLTDRHFNLMGKLLVLVSLVYVYFNINEIIVPAYKLREAEAGHILDLLVGRESVMFWIVQVGGLIIPFLLLLLKPMRKPGPAALISLIVVIGAWFKRYLIVIPVQLQPYLPIQNVPDSYSHYMPTWPEIWITVASFIMVIMIITLLAKLFPIISIWELQEETEKNQQS